MGMVRSLNLAVRKKETERIEQENHAFARRLFERAPNLDHIRLSEEYKQTCKLRKQIKKVDLPPIHPAPHSAVIVEKKKKKRGSRTRH
jgi:hypothetical protein